MLPAALEYPLGDGNGFRVYRPVNGGRSCEHFGGYQTGNRIPLPLPLAVHGKGLDCRVGGVGGGGGSF